MRYKLLGRWLLPLAAAVPLAVAAPAGAQASNTTAGTGALAGTLNYNNGTGIAVPPHPCVPNASWTLNAQSTTAGGQGGAVVLELTNNEFVGTITTTISGAATVCGDLVDDFGSLTSVAFDGSNAVTSSSLNCDSAPRPGGGTYGPLSGSYIRAGVHLHMALQGYCSVNANIGVQVRMAMESELEPAGAPSPNTLMSSFADSGAFAVEGQ
jgi:hypothetical protein